MNIQGCCSAWKGFVSLAFILALLSLNAAAQDTAPQHKAPAVPLEMELYRLQNCLSGDDNVQHLITGLTTGYNGQGSYTNGQGSYARRGRYGGGSSQGLGSEAPPPPPEYVNSIERDIDACQFAYHVKDSAERRQLLDAVHKDVQIKAKDCTEFGMGRMVPVRISTIQGNAAASGWAAFYKWSSVSSFPVSELRVPGLTSPATLNLPPGVYAFRAELKDPSGATKKTDVVTLAVGGQKVIDVQIPVP